MRWWKRLLRRVLVEPSLSGAECYFCSKVLGPIHAHAHETRHGMATCYCVGCGPRPPMDVVRRAYARMLDRSKLLSDPPTSDGPAN